MEESGNILLFKPISYCLWTGFWPLGLTLLFFLCLGYYAYLEVSNSKRNEKAVLSSPAYGGSYADCTMQFYYHMYGANVGVLKINLVNVAELADGPGDTVMFELIGLLLLVGENLRSLKPL